MLSKAETFQILSLKEQLLVRLTVSRLNTPFGSAGGPVSAVDFRLDIPSEHVVSK